MDMTLRYANIASRTVADEYFAVTEKVEALYDTAPALPAFAAGPEMARLHREMHQRMSRQRVLHPARDPGLHLRVGLRDLHLLPDQHRVQAYPASPARPRRQPRPARTTGALRQDPQRHRAPSIMIHPPRITHIMPKTERCHARMSMRTPVRPSTRT